MIDGPSESTDGPWVSLAVLGRPPRSSEEERRRWSLMVLIEEQMIQRARRPIDLIAISGC